MVKKAEDLLKIKGFSKTIKVDKNGCWNWLGTHNEGGYGTVYMRGENYMAHRVLYRMFVGNLSRKLQIDHLCRNRDCVNPTHLEQVTLRENILRGVGVTAINAKKTCCIYGHKFDDKNTLPDRTRGGRRCRKCAKIKLREWRSKTPTPKL